MIHRRITIILIALLFCVLVAAGAAGAAEATSSDRQALAMNEHSDEENVEDENDTSNEVAVFEIVDVETNTPVTAGETITTTVEVNNTGETAGETDVWFKLDEFLKDETEIELGPGENTTVSLSYVSKRDDHGTWTHTTATRDDVSEREMRIEAPDESSGSSDSGSSSSSSEANFEIVDLETNAPIDEGEWLNVSIRVENTGETEDEKRVWAEFEDERVLAETVSLEPGASSTLNGSYRTELGDSNMTNLTVGSPDDTVEESIHVELLESEFNLTAVDVPSAIVAGDSAEVTVEVTNTGDRPDQKQVWFALRDAPVDRTTLDLAANESETVTLTYNSPTTAVGEWNVSIATVDDYRNLSLVITDPATPTPAEATPTGTESNSTSTPADGGTPADGTGVGPVIAAVALLGGVLLAARLYRSR